MKEKLTDLDIRKAVDLLKENNTVDYIDPGFVVFCDSCKIPHWIGQSSPKECRKSALSLFY